MAAVLGVVASAHPRLRVHAFFLDHRFDCAGNALQAQPHPLATPASTAHQRRGARLRRQERNVLRRASTPPSTCSNSPSAEADQVRRLGKKYFRLAGGGSHSRPLGSGATDRTEKKSEGYHLPGPPPAPPIPLKFFGFANQPGEPKRVFLSKGDDVFIAGEGEIVDRRYKVVRISPTSVEIQDVVGSGPAQTIPLTQGNPS